jgi:hypothetical protein
VRGLLAARAVIPFTEFCHELTYALGSNPERAPRAVNFESTVTEADFQRPLLDAREEQMARQLHSEPDLAVDGLRSSLLARLLNLLSRNSR